MESGLENFSFAYRLKRQTECFGALELEVECLESLDETIDSLFAFLQKEGKESWLEQLCPYFGVVWPSARALSEFLVEQRSFVAGKTVLEIGCGLAVPSLVSSKLGAHVTATDFHPEVPRFLERNVALNRVQPPLYLHLDWQSAARPSAERYDWVVGSDILYERQQPELVAQAIEHHLAPGGKAVIADPARPYIQPFADEMTKRGFRYETRVKTVADHTGPAKTKDVFLLIFSKA